MLLLDYPLQPAPSLLLPDSACLASQGVPCSMTPPSTALNLFPVFQGTELPPDHPFCFSEDPPSGHHLPGPSCIWFTSHTENRVLEGRSSPLLPGALALLALAWAPRSDLLLIDVMGQQGWAGREGD